VALTALSAGLPTIRMGQYLTYRLCHEAIGQELPVVVAFRLSLAFD
jgi:hypothetical protein